MTDNISLGQVPTVDPETLVVMASLCSESVWRGNRNYLEPPAGVLGCVVVVRDDIVVI